MKRFIINCAGQMIEAPDTLAKLVDRQDVTFVENFDCFYILHNIHENFFFALKAGDLPSTPSASSDCIMHRMRTQTRIRDAAWIVGHKRKFIYDGNLYTYMAEAAVEECFLAIYDEILEDDLLIADFESLSEFHKVMVRMYGALYAGLRDQLPDPTSINEVQHFLDLSAAIHSIL